LTFEPHNGTNTNYAKYQGVYFKWGSLIGISPAQTSGSRNFSSGTATGGVPGSATIDGTPIYMKDPSGNWVKTNVAYATATNQKWLDWWSAVPDNTTDTAAWNAIPYQNNTSINTNNKDAYSLLANPDFNAYKGDICNYINPAYRMPTQAELAALGSGSSNTNGPYYGFTSSAITNQTADGKTAFTSTYGTFTGISGTTYYLPASGYRDSSHGSLYDVGDYGFYWSGSAYGSGSAYELLFSSSDAYAGYATSKSVGQPVRCVLQE
jgi:uncharacterized protein (TIGR02145 family)